MGNNENKERVEILILLIASIIAICLVEGIPLYKAKLRKELNTIGLLMGTTLLLAAGKILGLKTPLGMLAELLIPFGKVIFRHY